MLYRPFQKRAWSCVTSYYSPLRGSHCHTLDTVNLAMGMMLCSSMLAFEKVRRTVYISYLRSSGVAWTFGARGQQTLWGPCPSPFFCFLPFLLFLSVSRDRSPFSSGTPGYCPSMPLTRYATVGITIPQL